MSGFSAEEMQKAEQVLDSVREDWLQRPGVTAVDLGFKWTGGQMTDQLCIRVHVAKKKPPSELSEEVLFPREVDGILVDVLEATYAPQTSVETRLEAAVDGRGGRFDVIPLGVSVGSKYTTAGTLGAKVIDSDTGEEMILSNWHVLAGRSSAETGLTIWQPGWLDGGTRDENTIAKLSRWVLGPYDAAVARLTGDRPVQTTTLEGRAIEDVLAPRLGMLVWKSGRSTGLTEGFVDGVKMTIPLSYGEAGMHFLKDVFRVVPRPGSGNVEISTGGDSGSVWADEESGKAVGLHFAGEVGDNPEHALANDIGLVTKALKVRFPTQGPPPDQPPVDQPAPPRPAGPSLLDIIMSFLRRLFGRP